MPKMTDILFAADRKLFDAAIEYTHADGGDASEDNLRRAARDYASIAEAIENGFPFPDNVGSIGHEMIARVMAQPSDGEPGQ